ncbi:RNA chaperone Hfq [Pseudomonas guariconensis]|uniref:RNA chaperone Hfq n=1 Tax=Pseudomonas guariconensis TaxID=1288410 RepID=UPI003906BB67
MTNHYSDRPFIPQYDRSTNEQDRFLDYCERNGSLITVYLESGLTLQGKVVGHDRKVLLLGPMRSAKEPRLISKSYIAVIRAEEVLPLFLEYKGRGNHLTRKKARKAKRQDGSTPPRQLRLPKTTDESAEHRTVAPAEPGASARPVVVKVKRAPRSRPTSPNEKPPTPSDS